MSGWVQKLLFNPGGVKQAITVDPDGLTCSGALEDRGLLLKVFVGPSGLGEADVAIEGRINNRLTGSSSVYGRTVIASKNLEADPDIDDGGTRFKTEQTFTLYVEGTTALEGGPPDPPFENHTGSTVFGTIALNAHVPSSGYTIYYLEWWGNMVSDFGKKVKAELDGHSWDNAGAPDEIFLMLDQNLGREDMKAAFGDSLVLVHGVTEAIPEKDFEGGFGRKGRKLTCLVTCFVKSAAGINSSQEQAALETLDLFVEDVMQLFDPAGVPNLLDNFCYFTRTTPEGTVVDVPLAGVNAVARTVRVDGYKIESRS